MTSEKDAAAIVIVDRRATDEWREHIDKRVNEIGEEVSENTRLTREIEAKTSAIVEFFNAAQGGLKVLGWFGVGAKWLGVFAAAVSAIWVVWYQATHGGDLPKGK